MFLRGEKATLEKEVKKMGKKGRGKAGWPSKKSGKRSGPGRDSSPPKGK